MPDTYTYMILGYGVIIGGLMIYTVSLVLRQYFWEQKKKALLDEAQSSKPLSKKT